MRLSGRCFVIKAKLVRPPCSPAGLLCPVWTEDRQGLVASEDQNQTTTIIVIAQATKHAVGGVGTKPQSPSRCFVVQRRQNHTFPPLKQVDIGAHKVVDIYLTMKQKQKLPGPRSKQLSLRSIASATKVN